MTKIVPYEVFLFRRAGLEAARGLGRLQELCLELQASFQSLAEGADQFLILVTHARRVQEAECAAFHRLNALYHTALEAPTLAELETARDAYVEQMTWERSQRRQSGM
ncbi:MAG: hypothetical protein HZC25_08010 [Rhodospirillales bacterium]|nr:hypothetical protein [Rhodospirillales bacterium]